MGCSCWLGKWFKVRGVVKNLIDYLYGGGEGCFLIGRLKLVILWGKLVFGIKMW